VFIEERVPAESPMAAVWQRPCVLGASGVCAGTRLVASVESNAHDEYKRRIIEATEEDIARTCIFGPEWPDAPMLVIRNRVVREWAGNDAKTPPQPNPPQTIGKTLLGGREYLMPKFAAILPTPETTGDFEEMCLAAGESAALVTRGGLSATRTRPDIRNEKSASVLVTCSKGSHSRR
jgi:NAD(P)H-dependent flavin oxidoreductase YrpB (nitropropane dioxygenase family)